MDTTNLVPEDPGLGFADEIKWEQMLRNVASPPPKMCKRRGKQGHLKLVFIKLNFRFTF